MPEEAEEVELGADDVKVIVEHRFSNDTALRWEGQDDAGRGDRSRIYCVVEAEKI